MKKNHTLYFLLLTTLSIGQFLFPAQAHAAEGDYLLVDDFSGVDNYTNDPFRNPYWEQATQPSNGFHTNMLGLWTSGYSDTGYTGFDTITDAGGSLKLSWGPKLSKDGMNSWYWYTCLGSNALSQYTYLTLRMKAAANNTRVRIRIDPYGTERTYTLTNQWKSYSLKLEANWIRSGVDHNIVFQFYKSDIPTGLSSATVFIDDLLFVADPNYRPVSDGIVKPTSTGKFKVVGRKLTLWDNDFFIRGVNYSPCPIGQTPEYGTYNFSTEAIVKRDMPLIQAMGANAIRTWQRFDLYQDANYRRRFSSNLLTFGVTPYNIKLCAGFWIPHEISFCNEWAKARIREDFQDYVLRYRYEPKLLMWVIGNENNMDNGYDWRWYNFANELAKLAYQLEGASYHPVAIVEADIIDSPTTNGGAIGSADMLSNDANLNYVDIIGINVYRGKNISSFFTRYSPLTQKPLWVAEYGIDSWQTQNKKYPSIGYEDQTKQAEFDVKIWQEICRNKSVSIGAAVMEYSDEWWKDKTGALTVQGHSGYDLSSSPGCLPDNYMNEEWWGLVKIARSGSGTDAVTPRATFYELYVAKIGGKITDASGAPVANVQVKLYNAERQLIRSTLTDAYGLYSITKLPEAAYTLKLSRKGYRTKSLSATIERKFQTLIKDAVLTP